MSSYFTHLHVHTDYSLLDGAISLDKLVNFAKQQNIPSIGISDHGNIFGAVKFFQQCQKAKIKPVLGIEMYVTPDARIKDINNRYYHILLLVQNEIGYKNLCALLAYSYTDGFYFKPRIDYKILEKHNAGLIATSACAGGHLAQLVLQKNFEEAEKTINWHINLFGRERFFLEVQPELQAEQTIVNNYIWEAAKKYNLDTIASCDSHYTTQEDHEAHEVMLAIQTRAKMTDPDRFSFGECRVHLRTEQEMLELFKDHTEAVYNTGRVADMCNFSFKTGTLHFPKFDIPKEETEESFFKKLCLEGFEKLVQENYIPKDQELMYRSRLEEETDLIIKMGFIGYFLVVSDFINWAKQNNIPVGPGRGSAAGSLVAWSLNITGIDPIKYNLLFERFLNPERVTMPDIDIDFCIEGRERVIDYVREKYGHDKVCQIITFGTMMAKGVIKDVARALGLPFEDANMLTDMIPEQLKITLDEALNAEPKLKQLVENNPHISKLFDIAHRLEGLTRHASKHAAGIVISPEPIVDVLPVYIPPKTTELVTQYAMTELEYLGYLKMDFLGLKNLTLIKNILAFIKTNHDLTIPIDSLDMNDKATFELLCRGDTDGVFQLESDGIKDVLRRLQPSTFEDIIAVNALYRPGPLGSGMVDDFIERRHGRQPIRYIFQELEPVLKDTYGVIVYQEQVMKIASAIAGYSLGEADILRRAMGKKKAEEMAKQKSIFVTRATQKAFDTKKAEELFDLMAYFAGYGFNKSHSAAYALIAYQTAYLKAHFRPEFMSCLISLEVSNPDTLIKYLEHAREYNLEILPPDINQSDMCFTPSKPTNQKTSENISDKPISQHIRFGLQGVRNVGGAALEAVLQERAKHGPFKDLLDMCTRIDLRTCNKRVLESLICAGAFDCLPGTRAQKFNELGKIIDVSHEKKEAALTGQMGLFEIKPNINQTDLKNQFYVYQDCPDWTDKEKLEKEKEVLSVYITAQPLDMYASKLKLLSVDPLESARKPDISVTCCVHIKSTRIITTKKGDKMAFAQCEDKTSRGEIVIFPKLFALTEQLLKDYSIFIVSGTTDITTNNTAKIKAETCVPIDLIFETGLGVSDLTITLPEYCDQTMLTSIKDLLKPGTSTLSFIAHEHGKQVRITTKQKVCFCPQITQLIQKYHGDIKLGLISNKPAQKPKNFNKFVKYS